MTSPLGLYVDLQKWAEYHKDYDRSVVVITRCPDIAVLARLRTFGGTAEGKTAQGALAHKLIASWLGGSERIFLWSYETLVMLGGAYLKHMAREMGLSVDPAHMDKLGDIIKSGNPKYILDSPPSGQTIPPAPDNLAKL